MRTPKENKRKRRDRTPKSTAGTIPKAALKTAWIKTKEQTYDILVGDLQEGSSISSGEKIVKVPNGDSIIKCDLIK